MISTVKIARQMRSIAMIKGPAAAMRVFEVSNPNTMAFSTITAMIAFWVLDLSRNAFRFARKDMDHL